MKTQIILSLYEELNSGKTVQREEFCKNHFISERTFYRYVLEISSFLMKNKSKKVLYTKEGKGEYYFMKERD